MANMDELVRRRDQALAQFATLGDLRPGKLALNYRKCGKPRCHCAGDDSPGHGPSYVLNRSIRGKTRSIRIRPDEVAQTRALLDEHERFLVIAARYLEASEALADARRAEAVDTGAKRKPRSRRHGPRSPDLSSS